MQTCFKCKNCRHGLVFTDGGSAMRLEQTLWTREGGWAVTKEGVPQDAQVAFVFGAPEALTAGGWLEHVRVRYPRARLAICSTGGEIHGREVYDGAISVTALAFESVEVSAATIDLDDTPDMAQAGEKLAAAVKAPGLKSVFILSDGTRVNASELIRAMRSVLGRDVVLTGGLAGDGDRFTRTLVGLDTLPQSGRIVAIGFAGEKLRLGHGSCGGWDVFGPERKITRAQGSVLYELDGKPALDLYKRYLGEEAKGLPGSALLFPLRIYQPGRDEESLVRTVVGIDEEKRAMIFAGDVPQGYCGQLMKGNVDRLVEGAADAAAQASGAAQSDSAAILVSCIGRKLLFGQRTCDEVEAVSDVLGPSTRIAGFYSYGEISPHAKSGVCELHNQTMTVTVFSEE
jgi:hypothetical protein